MKILFYIYLAAMFVMSIVALISYKRDKSFAQKGERRTPEKTLLLQAACFGGIGAFAGMQIYRHKTKHLQFQILVPLSMIVQIILLGVIGYFAFIK